MKTQVETLRFQAEVQELLGLVIHSLYKHREIFLRELVSNASDALDKLRFEALTRPELAPPGASAKIRIEIDRENRALTVSDDGIGMDRAELESNLGTIARSGTKEFLARLHAQKSENAPELIGQFGVGFYSSFMVAREVVVETRRAGTNEAWRWRSEGRGEYSIEPAAKAEHGTRVTLYLRDDEKDDDAQDFLSEWTIRDIVKRYSDFVAYPIEMEVDDGSGKTGGRRTEVLNSMKPLWAKPKDEIERETYDEFYKHLTHDFEAPLEVIHLKAEGTSEYTALLYIPSHRPLDLFEGPEARSRIALYVKRVLIMPDSSELLPAWMRFVRGVVDSADLPLNVSREVLQSSATVRSIGKRLTKKVIETLASMQKDDGERYARFWHDFGMLLKEGIYVGDDTDGSIAKIALFATTHEVEGRTEPMTTLSEYVARMKPDQKGIYYLAGSDRAALSASPHVESMRRRGFEVLLFTDPIDEFLAQRMREFDKKPLLAIDRGELELDSQAEQEARETLEREHRDLLKALEEALAAHVKSVRFTTRLSGSPAVLVSDAHGLSPHMERVLRAARQDVQPSKRVLELDPDHPVVQRLVALHRETPRSPLLSEAAELVLGQALLAEGSPVPDGARFAKLVAKWMVGASEPRASVNATPGSAASRDS